MNVKVRPHTTRKDLEEEARRRTRKTGDKRSNVTVIAPIKTRHPHILLLTACACNMCKIMLKRRNSLRVDHMLRKVVVEIGHREN